MIKLTEILIVVGVTAYALYDIVASFYKGATISEVIRKWSYENPVVPFVIGFVCGHWFW